METYKIALSAGDGIGEELVLQAKKVLKALEQRFGAAFEVIDILSCGPAIDAYGTAMRDEDIEAALGCRGILFGNIGDAQKVSEDPKLSPVYALTSMRKAFQVCTNTRPVRILPETASLSPLKESITAQGMDILIIRDLMGGMIAGERHRWHGIYGEEASDLEHYTEDMIRHSAEFAFRAARSRKKKLTSVDKANVLYSGKLWRKTVNDVGAGYPDDQLTHHYVDNAAMELLVHPSDFDVVLASNVFWGYPGRRDFADFRYSMALRIRGTGDGWPWCLYAKSASSSKRYPMGWKRHCQSLRYSGCYITSSPIQLRAK